MGKTVFMFPGQGSQYIGMGKEFYEQIPICKEVYDLALGLAGFFANKKHGLQIGYIVAVFGRYVFAVISGVVFFGAYAPEGTPAIVYSLTYNATYIVPEAIATLIEISLPPVAKALAQVKKNALSA